MKFVHVSFVVCMLLVLVLTGCISSLQVPQEEHPKNMEEFEAEAELYSMANSLNLDTARMQVQKLYPEFVPVLDNENADKPFGVPKVYTFLECEDSDGGLDINNAGTVYATYMNKGIKYKVSLRDRCTDDVMQGVAAEFYCSGNRPAKKIVECSCWDERSCK